MSSQDLVLYFKWCETKNIPTRMEICGPNYRIASLDEEFKIPQRAI